MMTHHSVMTSSLRIKISKFDKFGDFSSDIDFNSRIVVFRDAIYLIINQCDPRRPKGASGGHFVSASRAAQASKRSVCRNYNSTFPFCANPQLQYFYAANMIFRHSIQ